MGHNPVFQQSFGNANTLKNDRQLIPTYFIGISFCELFSTQDLGLWWQKLSFWGGDRQTGHKKLRIVAIP
jgi:hypothetical protein